MSATDQPVRRLTSATSPGSCRRRAHPDADRVRLPDREILDEAGHPMILVGDSLGRVMLGYENEFRVSMADMLHHTRAVVRGAKRALISATCRSSPTRLPRRRVANAGRFLPEGGARAVKVEGGVRSARTIESIVKAGIPVMGHIGWTPQAQYRLGARSASRARPGPGAGAAGRRARRPGGRRLRDRPRARAGTARRGDHRAAPDPDHRHRAGAACSGQVQVITDLLGLGDCEAEARPRVCRPAWNDPRAGPRPGWRRHRRHVPRPGPDGPDVRRGARRCPRPHGDDRAPVRRSRRRPMIPLDRDL